MGNDSELINLLKSEEIIPMDPFKERAIASLRMEEGRYGEVFIYNKGDGFFSVNQLKLDPFSATLYSTKADEFQAIQELQKQGFLIEQAIDWLVTNRSAFLHLVKKQNVKEAIALLMTSNPKKGEIPCQKI